MTFLKRYNIFAIALACLMMLMTGYVAHAQIQVGNDLSEVDYSFPREYEIGGITVTGVQYVDPAVVVMLSGLNVGMKIKVPGDKISEANVVVKKIYNYDDEAAANLTGMNSENLAFELTYDLKPASDSKALIEELTGGNGTYNEETGWIEGKVGVGILAPNPDGTNPEYVIDLLASSF